MKWVFSGLVIIFVLTACTNGSHESEPLPKRLSDLPVKRDVPLSFFTGSSIVPIAASSSFTEVSGWYDDETVLYLEDENEQSSLLKHHLYTGDSSVFFDTEGWIVDVNANVDYSLFAIEVINQQDEANLFIVDQEGEVQMNIEGFGNDYTVYWNPFDQERMMMVSYLPDWEFDVLSVDVSEEKISQVEFEQAYIQWLSETDVGYIKWNELQPSYEAPLYQVHVDTGDEKLLEDQVIAFMSFADRRYLTVTVDTVYDLYSIYTFYENGEPSRQVEMPILNTYSEQWWIPFYTYDEASSIFYYLRPKYSGDYFSYNDGYELIAYHVQADSEEQLTELANNDPLMVSPNGDFLLIGTLFENVYDIKEKVLVSVLKE